MKTLRQLFQEAKTRRAALPLRFRITLAIALIEHIQDLCSKGQVIFFFNEDDIEIDEVTYEAKLSESCCKESNQCKVDRLLLHPSLLLPCIPVLVLERLARTEEQYTEEQYEVAMQDIVEAKFFNNIMHIESCYFVLLQMLSRLFYIEYNKITEFYLSNPEYNLPGKTIKLPHLINEFDLQHEITSLHKYFQTYGLNDYKAFMAVINNFKQNLQQFRAVSIHDDLALIIQCFERALSKKVFKGEVQGGVCLDTALIAMAMHQQLPGYFLSNRWEDACQVLLDYPDASLIWQYKQLTAEKILKHVSSFTDVCICMRAATSAVCEWTDTAVRNFLKRRVVAQYENFVIRIIQVSLESGSNISMALSEIYRCVADPVQFSENLKTALLQLIRYIKTCSKISYKYELLLKVKELIDVEAYTNQLVFILALDGIDEFDNADMKGFYLNLLHQYCVIHDKPEDIVSGVCEWQQLELGDREKNRIQEHAEFFIVLGSFIENEIKRMERSSGNGVEEKKRLYELLRLDLAILFIQLFKLAHGEAEQNQFFDKVKELICGLAIVSHHSRHGIADWFRVKKLAKQGHASTSWQCYKEMVSVVNDRLASRYADIFSRTVRDGKVGRMTHHMVFGGNTLQCGSYHDYCRFRLGQS